MAGVFIIAAARSPVGVGKPGGALSGVTPLDLMAQVLREVPRRAGIDPALVQDVILGCVSPLGEQGANIARLAALKAGFPVEVPGVTLNRMCGSSQQAVHFAAQAIASGDMEMVIAGGVESLTREALDDFSYESHLRAGTAARAGRFAPEILPIPVCVDGATHPVTADEGIRLNPDRAKMAALKAVFKEGGVITAGNSSQISDG